MLCLISAHCPLSPGPGLGCWLLLRLGLGRVLLLYSLDLLRCFLGAGGGSVHVYWNGGGGLHTSMRIVHCMKRAAATWVGGAPPRCPAY